MWRCAEGVPVEWYGESCEMERLVETLLKRRRAGSGADPGFQEFEPEPFPNWREK